MNCSRIRGLVLAILVLLAAISVAWAAANTPQTLTGLISDTMCKGGKHMFEGKSDADCIRACVKAGPQWGYALVVGNKVYKLQGQAGELDKLAGQKARVTGTVRGDSIQVSAVVPAHKP